LQAERLSKNKFLELLQKTGTAKNSGKGQESTKKERKEAEEDEDESIKQEPVDKPHWDVLSDDYMLRASLKDLPGVDGDEGE